MRPILFITFLSLFSAQAQFGFMKRAQIETLKNDTLVVVLREDSTFNTDFTYAIEHNWTLSAYKFVNRKDLDKYYTSDQEVFMIGHFNGMFYLNPNGADNVDFIGLLSNMNFSTSVSLKNRERIGAHLYYNPKNSGKGILCAYVRSLETYLRKIDSKIVGSQAGYIKHIGAMKKEATGKPILINFDDDFHISKDEITSKNKALVKSVTRMDINEATVTKEDAVFFVPISAGGRYFLYLFSCKDGNLHYFTHVRDWNKLPGVAENKMLKALQ